jgi:hypothetical protein
MGLSKDWREFLELLNSRGVDYIIVGAHSIALHGRPRYTGDLDIFVRSTPENALIIVDVLNKFGFAQSKFKEPDFLKPGLELICPPALAASAAKKHLPARFPQSSMEFPFLS